MIKIIIAMVLVSFTSHALTQKDCSLHCKGRFFSQKGVAIVENFLKDNPMINKKVIDESLKGADKDQKLAIGCLTTCKVKDIRDIICLLLREGDDNYIKKLSMLFAYNKKADDFTQEHESACKKFTALDADNITMNYKKIRAFLASK